MRQRKKIDGNKGFSFIELIIAVAILAIVSVSIVLAMTTSSRTYSESSVEAQLQSEAQMVANAISEIAIDASGASAPTAEWIADISADADKFTKHALGYLLDDSLLTANQDQAIILDATENYGSAAVPEYHKVQYIIARSNPTAAVADASLRPDAGAVLDEDKIYLAKRRQDDSGTWEALEDFSLLGDYISSFSASMARVDTDNLLKFELVYSKSGKIYNGNYQVLMRNKAYARVDTTSPVDDEEVRITASITPKLLYLVVRQGQVPEYYKDAVVNSADYKVTRTDGGGNVIKPITLNGMHVSNQSNGALHSQWGLDTQAAGVFSLGTVTDSADPLRNPLVTTNRLDILENAEMLKMLPYDSFKVSYALSARSKEGEAVTSNAAVCTVRILRVRGMTLQATGGFTTEWKDGWNGTPEEGVNGYAYSDSSGKLVDMTLNAAIDCTDWIPFNGGVSWKLEKNDGTGWSECTNPNFARLVVDESANSTLNTLQFGKSAMNGQKYRITATSLFDPDYSSELIIGIGKSGDGNTDGFYSRGFYVDITSWMEREKGVSETIARVTVTKDESWEGANVQIINGDDGRIYLYVSYDSFANATIVSGINERVRFYDGSGTLTLQAYGVGNNLLKDNTGQTSMTYQMGKVLVTRVEPSNQVVVVAKGATKSVKVKTAFYNLISKDYFGIFVDDMETNLNRQGMAGTHKDIKVETAGAYGDLYNYVEQMSVNVSPKTSMRDYNPYPMRLRLAALDYYNLTRQNHDDGTTEYAGETYQDYIVYVANVKDADVFIPGPATTGASAKIDGSGLTWPEGVGSAKVSIDGYDSNGNIVHDIGKVYVKNNKTMLDYKGTTYTYSKTYHYWNK